jgi:hypothetical protein
MRPRSNSPAPRPLAFLLALPLGLTACQTEAAPPGPAHDAELARALGLNDSLTVELIADGLQNPSWVSFSPDGVLTVCDSGHGRVAQVVDGELTDYITGFPTEYWKVDAETGAERFQLGPLSAAWMGTTLVVTDAGRKDGEEMLRFFDGAGIATDGRPGTPFETEGNLTGLYVDGERIFVAGQGSDDKSWVLVSDAEGNLSGFASADEHGIETNSPMQTWVRGDKVLCVYSGAGGVMDGRLVEWNADGTPHRQWTLPGLADPMGFAPLPGGQLAMVDNNWALTEVQAGRLARVTLPEAGGEAQVEMLADALQGPVHCAMGPDGRLYVTQLGERFDAGLGQVLAIGGF